MDLVLSITEDFYICPDFLRIDASIRIILSRKISFSRFEFFIHLFFSRAVLHSPFFRLFSSVSSRGIISPKKKPCVVPTKLKCTRQARLTRRRPRVKGPASEDSRSSTGGVISRKARSARTSHRARFSDVNRDVSSIRKNPAFNLIKKEAFFMLLKIRKRAKFNIHAQRGKLHYTLLLFIH